MKQVNSRMLFMQPENDEYQTVKMFSDYVCSLIPDKTMCRDIYVIS